MDAEFEEETDPLAVSRTCKICKTVYTLGGKDFLGRLGCREHASEYIIKQGGRFVWPCCGVQSSHATPSDFYAGAYQMSLRGCVRCDHKDDSFVPYNRREPVDRASKGIEYSYGDPSVVVPRAVIERKYIHPEESQTEPLTATRTEIYLYDRKGAEDVNKNRPRFPRD